MTYLHYICLILPFCSTLMIVFNVYNGDILGINENLEYMLWYIPISLSTIYNKICKNIVLKFLLPELSLIILGVSINIYWSYAWDNDSTTNFRHRTEYYDSQCLMCSINYSVLLYYYFLIINNKTMVDGMTINL